jgi:hypothetical protein
VLVGGFRNLASILRNVVQQIDGSRVSRDFLMARDASSFSTHVLELGFVEGSGELKMVADGS